MSPLSVTEIVLLATALVAGAFAGWLIRGVRAGSEKDMISQAWREQLEKQQEEQRRLRDQNNALKEEVGQHQATHEDAKRRASELSSALKDAFERRDELQRQIKEIRNNLEATVARQNKLHSQADGRGAEEPISPAALQQRDQKIAQLNKDIDAWRRRIHPLIDKFRARNGQAERLEHDLALARHRIRVLESLLNADETRIEPAGPATLGADLDASNDPLDNEVRETEPLPDEAVAEEAAAVRDSAAADRLNGQGPDDLKQIKGVGPAIEKTLNEVGIHRLQQIAEMSEYDIDRVAQRLKGFRSRIYREDWIGQARDLLDQTVSGSA